MRLTTESGGLIAERVTTARGPVSRLVGLIGRRELPTGEALMIQGCAWVHTLFLRFPIDVVYVDRDMRIIRIDRHLRPWSIGCPCGGTSSVIEIAGGTATDIGLAEGDFLRLSSE
jgi:hypothetical protein